MTSIVFVVSEIDGGWVVNGASRLGPFLSRERAMDLAEGMAGALRTRGVDAEVKLEAPICASRPRVDLVAAMKLHTMTAMRDAESTEPDA